jgi:hypothetical protein
MRFWTSIFFLVTAGALCLATYQTVQILSGRGKPESATAIGELLLVIVLGIGEILAFSELRHMGREEQFQSWLKAQEVWTQDHFRDGRGKIFQRLHSGATAWTEQERQEALEVCRKMDEFAHLLPFLGIERALDVWDDPLAKAWIVLEQVVKDERDRSRWQTKWKGFEAIGRKASEKLIREGRNPDPQI